MDNLRYPTIEHYFQRIVRKTHSPGTAAKDGCTLPMRLVWDRIRIKVMEEALMTKFQ